MLEQTHSKSDLGFTWHWEDETLVLCPKGPKRGRRVLVVGFASTGPDLFLSWLESRFGGHGMWGCMELAANGYEVLLPRIRSRNPRSPSRLLWDLGVAMGAASRLTRNDIVYCNHNVMFWAPFLRSIGRVKAKIVGLLFAREPLPIGRAYDGVIGMTRIATEHGRKVAGKAKHAHIPWGIELTPDHHCYRQYDPKWALSCGVTGRDQLTAVKVYQDLDLPLRVCARGQKFAATSEKITVYSEMVSPEELTQVLYRFANVVLITLRPDPNMREAVGYTNLLESMAMGRAVIKTKTGAVDDDINVEQSEIGLYVDPSDESSLKRAVTTLLHEPERAEGLGKRGRKLAEEYYNMARFGIDLHNFFESLG